MDKNKEKQAEVEVVPSSSLVEFEVGVEVEVGVEIEVGVDVGIEVGIEVEVDFETTFSVGVGGWLEKTGLKLSHLQSLSLS